MHLPIIRLTLLGLTGFLSVWNLAGAPFPVPFNTEKSTNVLTPPEQALKMMALPPGFRSTLFAAEPDVQQPIGMTTDERGRLWVAENYTYAESKVGFESGLRDRILVFEDTNHDGKFDKRTVFWDQANKLTSVEVGFGGVWALCAPNLLFIPDKDGDGVPDGEPVKVLDGWNDNAVRHNIVNGLRWGPDGWLYGRHGILATSSVGAPGTPENQRTKINCGIWRYHPTRKVFEVVAQGTTNPWGMDYDDFGEMFFINTVIGHLFHVIPGAHYKRMYGEDLTPRTYDLIDQHADHYHWDTGKSWTDSREGKGEHGRLGGGHAHSGMMVYLGDNWPDTYRNSIFTVNLHGRRLNNDYPYRQGSGYSASHGADLFKTEDPWYRAVELVYGPDGGVFLADWSDVGECHENDGVHRTSGRIFKITYGEPARPEFGNLAALGDVELARLQSRKNDWHVRQSRRILQERAAAGGDMTAVWAELRAQFAEQKDPTRKLRAMWALHVTGGAAEPWLLEQLSHENEHVRAWAVRLLGDGASIGGAAQARFAERAVADPSALVRLYLASSLQRLPLASRKPLAKALLAHAEDAQDHNLPLLLWYGIEPVVGGDPREAAALLEGNAIPTVRRFLARRVAEEIEKNPEFLDAVLRAAQAGGGGAKADVLAGISEALRGWRKAAAPAAWASFQAGLAASGDTGVQDKLRQLSLLFGDGRALGDLQRVALDEASPRDARRKALETLLENHPPGILPMLLKLAGDPPVAVLAMRGLVAYDAPNAAEIAIGRYRQYPREERQEVLAALVARPAFAGAVLQAIADGKIARADLAPYHARQIRSLGNEKLNSQLSSVWGDIRDSAADKLRLMAKYKAALTPDTLRKANLSKGRELFTQSCGLCHTLYGEGGKVGPDITGSGRQSIDYLLENIVDPSAVVGADYKMSVVAMKDGRVLNGIVTAKTDRTLTLQTMNEKVSFERSEATDIKTSNVSLMPEGVLEGLAGDHVRDLIAYLMSNEQVALPGETTPKGSRK